MRQNLIAAGASILMMGASSAHAQGIQITPAGSTPTRLGAAQNFNGHVAVDMKAAGESGKHGSVGMVDFAPGARTAWHTHPVGQLLIVTEGVGWVQEEGQPRREIKAGDVVWIEAGVKHWHGAAADSWFAHLAVAVPAEGASNEWLEPVADEEYRQLP